MKLNYDKYSLIPDSEHDKTIMRIEWSEDIRNMNTEIKIQEMLVEYFKGEVIRLSRLLAESEVNPH